MNQQTQSQAQRVLNDLHARGVEVRYCRTDGQLYLQGGKQRPGEFDRLKRYKTGIVALLIEEGKYEMHVSDSQEPEQELKPYSTQNIPNTSKVIDTTAGREKERKAATVRSRLWAQKQRAGKPRYKPKEGDEEMSPALTAPEPVFAPLDESKPRKKGATPNWAKPKEKVEKKDPRTQTPIKPGDKYNSWEVLERLPNNDRKHSFWLCRCICGKEKPVEGISLRRTVNPSTSCGCKKSAHIKHDWDTTDWSLSNRELAKIIGCNHETVRYRRAKHTDYQPTKKPRSNHHES